jgi:hypothetical protein
LVWKRFRNTDGDIDGLFTLRDLDPILSMSVYFQGSLFIEKSIVSSMFFPGIIDLSRLVAQIGNIL